MTLSADAIYWIELAGYVLMGVLGYALRSFVGHLRRRAGIYHLPTHTYFVHGDTLKQTYIPRENIEYNSETDE